MTYFCPVCWREMTGDEVTCHRCGADIERGWEAKSYVEKLMASLRHPEPATPIRAAWVLGELRAREAVPVLMDLARSSPDLFLRKAAVEALGRIGDPNSVDLLRALARSESALVCRAASRALLIVEGPPGNPGPAPTTSRDPGGGGRD